ncbi:aldose epimerase family protein [Saccharicrinis fermentans]|uniref:Aldose 1-epimerase n=1 Tax=Saccharicrinis fermentans DSM 9555 = JCM 21142 TaxID=869213 RepID=W7Y6G8_9BACT|nr:aldose epimerase family protein [Saccharicrinis fermentans]GAF03802.1 aldose 1-epimerase precursor [Saccharicrinis fermentans DSM 9555 = JCM 21142]
MMKSTHNFFGKYQDQEITQFVLENDNGMVVKILDLGATISSITIPGKDKKPISIVCGFDSLDGYFSDEYKSNAPYFGCTVGRYCSQIKDAKFSCEGKSYQLAKNCGDNNLHGGRVGFDKRIWEATPVDTQGKVGVQFHLVSKDGDEGFPGNVEATVMMWLTKDNELVLNYNATTDQTTPLSMTNHSYFNLSGFERSVEGFKVQVNSNKLQEMDHTGAGTGKILDVSGTVNDLRAGKVISDVQEKLGDGFEHFYIFENPHEELKPVAKVEDPASGRSLEVFSTEPCMLLYTAKYMSNKLKRKEDEIYGKYSAFACETHRWQNGPNIEGSPRSFTKPNEVFKSTTVFKLAY